MTPSLPQAVIKPASVGDAHRDLREAFPAGQDGNPGWYLHRGRNFVGGDSALYTTLPRAFGRSSGESPLNRDCRCLLPEWRSDCTDWLLWGLNARRFAAVA